MNNNNLAFYVDVAKVRKMLLELQGKDFRKVYNSTVRRGAVVLKREVDKGFKNRTDLQRRDTSIYGFKPGKAVITRNRRYGVYAVHIMADYMMKWFEMGTKNRYVRHAATTKFAGGKGNTFIVRLRRRKKRPAGHITATHIFRDTCIRMRGTVFAEMEKKLVKEIQKINNKYR